MIVAISHLSPNGQTGHGDVFGLLAAPASVRTAIDEPGELSLTFLPGQLVGVKTKDVLRCTYDDGSFTEWRVSEVRTESPGLTTQVSAEPIWTDLDASVMRRTTAPGDVTLSPIFHGLTTEEVLGAILSEEWSRPPRFRAGTVPSSLRSEKPVVQGVGITHLEALRQLSNRLGCEWELRYDDGLYYIDLVREVGVSSQGSSTNPYLLYGEGQDAARITLKSTDDADLYTRIIPLAGDAEFPSNISNARWTVDTVTYSPTSNQTTVLLRELPHPITGSRQLHVGDRFGTDSTNFIIANSGSPNVLFLEGDASGLLNQPCRFLTADGKRKAHLDAFSNRSREATLERALMLDVEPAENMLAEAGISADMGSVVDGWPEGTSAKGSATATIVTDPLYVTWGTQSLRVEADAGEGIESGALMLSGDYYSMWARLRVESGRVAIDLVNTNTGKGTPGDRAYAVSGPDTELSVGGMEVAAGQYRVELRALDDDTVFYLDTWTLTRTVGPVRFQPQMGLRHLFVAGLRQLIRDSDRALSGALEAEYLAIPATSDIKLGSYVRLRDARYQSGNQEVWGIEATGRVVEMTALYSPLGHYKKAIRLSRRSRTAADRIAGLSAAPGSGSTTSGFGSTSPQTASRSSVSEEEVLEITAEAHYTKDESDTRYAFQDAGGTTGLSTFVDGTPGPNQVLMMWVATAHYIWTGTGTAGALGAPNTDRVLTVYQNAQEVGTVLFDAGVETGSLNGDAQIMPGDTIVLVAPDDLDTAFEGVSVTLVLEPTA